MRQLDRLKILSPYLGVKDLSSDKGLCCLNGTINLEVIGLSL
jgi:hypothetical protein